MAQLADFIPQWVTTDFLAVLTKNVDGDYIYRAGHGGSGTDTPVHGDLNLGPNNDTPLTGIRIIGSTLRFNEGGPLNSGTYFSGDGSDLYLFVQYNNQFAKLSVDSAYTSGGSGFSNFSMTSAFDTLLDGIPDGEEYIFGLGRYSDASLSDLNTAGLDVDFAAEISSGRTDGLGDTVDIYNHGGSNEVGVLEDGELGWGSAGTVSRIYVHPVGTGVPVADARLAGGSGFRDYLLTGAGSDLTIYVLVGSTLLSSDDVQNLVPNPVIGNVRIPSATLYHALNDIPSGTHFVIAAARTIPSQGVAASFTATIPTAAARINAIPPFNTGDFNLTNLEADFLALLRVNRTGVNNWYVYRSAEDVNQPTTDDRVIDGELGLGGGQTRITAIRSYDNTASINTPIPYPLILNDNNLPEELQLGPYFAEGGAGRDLTLHIQTESGGLQSVTVESAFSMGGTNYVNFNLPAAMFSLLNDLSTGDYFLFAATRPSITTTVAADAGPDQNIGSGEEVRIGRTASVTDGVGTTTYSWQRVSGTGGSLSSTTARRPRFTAPTLAPGSDPVVIVWRVTATNNGVSDSDEVTVTVSAAPAPTPPLAWANPPNQDNTAGTNVSVQLAEPTGGDGTAITYAATSIPTGILFNTATRTFEGRPTTPGTHSVSVTATQDDDVVAVSFTWIVRATVTGVAITSTPATDDTYGLGETIEVTVSFSHSVSQSNSGVRIIVGTSNFGITYFAGSGTPQIRYRHSVLENEVDANGISLPANGLLGTLRSGGVDINEDYAAVPDQANHKVDATRTAPVAPTISPVVVTRGTAGFYAFPAITGNPLPVASVTSDLPAGFTFANGRLTWGQNTQVGAFTVTYRLTNSLGFSETTFSVTVLGSFGALFTTSVPSMFVQVHAIALDDRTGLQTLELGVPTSITLTRATWLNVGEIHDDLLPTTETQAVNVARFSLSYENDIGVVALVLEREDGTNANLDDAFEAFENAFSFDAENTDPIRLDPDDAVQTRGYAWTLTGANGIAIRNAIAGLVPLSPQEQARSSITLDDGRRAITGSFHSLAPRATARLRLQLPPTAFAQAPRATFVTGVPTASVSVGIVLPTPTPVGVRASFVSGVPTASVAVGVNERVFVFAAARFSSPTPQATVRLQIFSPIPTARFRNFRYAMHIPSTSGLPAWAYWNGKGSIILDNVEYQGGQFASYVDVDPVSGLVGGELADSHNVLLHFSATGLFRTWLLSGDAAGRAISVYSLVEKNDGTWAVVNRIASTTVGLTRLRRDGIIAVSVNAKPADAANLPERVTHEVHLREFPGDRAFRWRGRIAKGYKVDFP